MLSAAAAFLVGAMLLSSCSLLPGYFGEAAAERHSRDQMARIVDALNAQDADALAAMFTDDARAQYSAEIDHGLEHLLSLFPDGDVVWDEEDGGSHRSEIWRDGRQRVFVGSGYRVTSGSQEFSVSFDEYPVNAIDPDEVGLFTLSAVPRTDSGNSPLEIARTSWRASDAPPGVFVGDDGGLSRDRSRAIVEALARQDAAGLAVMFTEYIRAEHAADLDKGLAYLLSLFADGDVVWEEGRGASAITERILDGKRTELQTSFDTVMSGGIAYRLFFAELTQNDLDPDRVGLTAIGAAPQTDYMYEVPEAQLHHWAETFEVTGDAHPGVFIPEERLADERMQSIAGALDAGDADALRSLFSSAALAAAPHLEEGIDHLLGLVGGGGMTWTLHEVRSFADYESGRMTQFVTATYRVSVGGDDYRLFFSDFPVNEVRDSNNVGLYALAVVPWTRDPEVGCVDAFDAWTCSMSLDGSTERGYAGIFLP